MPRNNEVKIRLSHEQFQTVQQTLDSLAHRAADLHQEDYFFAVPAGRLKLRIQPPATAELIAYHRPDTPAARISEYHSYRTATPEQLKRVLLCCLPLEGIVRKTRTVYLIRRTRIHLDRVDGLGQFIELETAIGDGPDAVAQARAETELLLQQLGLAQEPRIGVAYLDLLRNDNTTAPENPIPGR